MSDVTRTFVGGWGPDHSAELDAIDAELASVKAAREQALAALIARPRTGDEPKLTSANLIRPRATREAGFQAVRAEGAYVQVELSENVGRAVRRTRVARRIEDAAERSAIIRQLVGLVDGEAEAAAFRRRAALKGVGQ